MSAATIGALRVVLGLDSAAFTEGLTAAQRHLRGVGQRFQRVGEQMAGMGRTLSVAVTAPILALGVQMSRTAIDAEEMASAFNVSFGSMASGAERWAQTTGDAMGRSTQEMQRSMLTMHGLFKAGGDATDQTRELAQQFAVLAQDLSSFHNVTPEDALDRLRAGLSGEAEPLRRFNVYLNDAAVRARAVEMGLARTTAEVSEQAKIMARANLIMEATSEAQGDVARTSDSTANQIRRAQAAWEELSVVIGSRILPLVTPLVEKLASMAEAFGRLTPQTQGFVMAGAGIAAVVGPLLMFIGGIVSAIGTLIPVLTAAAIGIASFAAAVTSPAWAPVAVAVAGVVAAVAALVGIWGRVKDTVLPILTEFQAKFSAAFGPRIQALMDAIRPLVEGISGALSAFGNVAFPVLDRFGAAVEAAFGMVLERTLNAALAVMTGVFDAVVNLIRMVGDILTGDWSGAWNAACDLVMGLLRSIWGVVEAIFPGITGHLRRLYEAAREWLQQRLGGIFTWVEDRVEAVGDAFHNLWDRVVGHSYVPDMVEGIAEWMARLDEGMVQPALAATNATADAFADMADTVDRVFDRMLTDGQRAVRELRREMAALDQALAQGSITREQHGQAAAFLQNEYLARDLQTPTLTDTTTSVPGFDQIQGFFSDMNAEIEATRDAWGQAFANGIEAAMKGDLTDLLRSWVAGWARQGLESIGRDLFDMIGGSRFGNIFTQAITGGGGKLPGFATGGSFRVGGRSGIDKNVVAFRATRGEMVDIRRPGQDMGGGRSVSFDLRGAVMTSDLLQQMQDMAALSGGMAYEGAMAGVPASLARDGRNRLGR